MKVFLDTSVVIAGCRSSKGASRFIFDISELNQWRLFLSPFVVAEVSSHLSGFSDDALSVWHQLQSRCSLQPDVLAFNRPVILVPTKDKPIVFSAWSCADVMLTLDQRDFGSKLGTTFYGLEILRPGDFVSLQRACGRLIEPDSNP